MLHEVSGVDINRDLAHPLNGSIFRSALTLTEELPLVSNSDNQAVTRTHGITQGMSRAKSVTI
jgi:hypothetical protein